MAEDYNLEVVEKAREEWKAIIRATNSLYECTSMLDEELLGLENLDESKRNKRKIERCGACFDNEDIWQMVDEHAKYQDYLIKNLPILRKLLMPSRLQKYFHALRDFEVAVHAIDSGYPIDYRYTQE